MKTNISYKGLEITVTHPDNNKSNDSHSNSEKPVKEDAGDSSFLPGLPHPLTERDKQIMDQTMGYAKTLADRGLL